MAPRRGGSSSGSSIGSVNNQCDDYGAFSDGYSQAQIAIYGVFLLLFLILAFVTAKSSAKRKKNNRRRTILRWFHYGIALFLVLASLIVLIVRYVLAECGVIYYLGDEYTGMSVAVFIVLNLADLFLLALILFVVTYRMFQLAGAETLRRVFLIFDLIFFTLVSVLYIARAVMNGVLSYEYRISRQAQRSYRQLTEAYFVLVAVLAMFASVGLIIAAVKLWRKPERKLGIVGWVPVLIVAILTYFLYNVANVFILYHDRDPDTIGILVGYGIGQLGYFTAFFAIFMIARGTGWEYLDEAQAAQNPANTSYNQYTTYASTAPHTQPVGGYQMGAAPYLGAQQVDPKRTSYPTSTTPAPPYAATGIPYSGGGVYNPPQQQGQTYPAGNWSAGGYPPTHPASPSPVSPNQAPAPYANTAFGVANRGMEPTELAART
ncbi:hypothetical protein TWF696_009572 [Orbilia brochopaga]|uniref:Uncharacterized protein n=1 Tax=Orbilia brochopaga TaxID=3140254 RepID=A0AAV9UCL3_9PEZI